MLKKQRMEIIAECLKGNTNTMECLEKPEESCSQSPLLKDIPYRSSVKQKTKSSNLPRIDLLMLGDFLAANKDFCSSEFKNVKTSLSSRPSYGDDAISYVQIKWEGNVRTVKCMIYQEHKVHTKLYAVTLMVDEDEEKVKFSFMQMQIVKFSFHLFYVYDK